MTSRVGKVVSAIMWLVIGPIALTVAAIVFAIHIETNDRDEIKSLIDSGCSKTNFAIISDGQLVQVYNCEKRIEVKGDYE